MKVYSVNGREELIKNTILVGRKQSIQEVSDVSWRRRLTGSRETIGGRLDFMTPEHHLVRYAAVRELPGNSGMPLKPNDLAQVTKLPLKVTNSILGELEKRLFFLVRNDAGEVSWAYPVTTDRTPHLLTFSTGERLFGA